jgi:hypothetical protein
MEYNKILRKNKHLKKIGIGTLTEPVTTSGYYQDNEGFWCQVSWRSGQVAIGEGKSSELIRAEQEWAELYNNNAIWTRTATITAFDVLWDEHSQKHAKELVRQGVIPNQQTFILEKLGLLKAIAG